MGRRVIRITNAPPTPAQRREQARQYHQTERRYNAEAARVKQRIAGGGTARVMAVSSAVRVRPKAAAGAARVRPMAAGAPCSPPDGRRSSFPTSTSRRSTTTAAASYTAVLENFAIGASLADPEARTRTPRRRPRADRGRIPARDARGREPHLDRSDRRRPPTTRQTGKPARSGTRQVIDAATRTVPARTAPLHLLHSQLRP